MMLVESLAGAPLSFHVIPWDAPRAQLTLQARSARHKREWTLLLKRVSYWLHDLLDNIFKTLLVSVIEMQKELSKNFSVSHSTFTLYFIYNNVFFSKKR